MRALADFTIQPGDAGTEEAGGATLAFSGEMLVSSVGAIDARLRALDEPIARIDLSDVERMDTVGAWTVWRLAQEQGAEIVGARSEAERLIAAVGQAGENDSGVSAPRLPLFERVPGKVGDAVVGLAWGSLQVLGFLGQVVQVTGTLLRHPGRFRGKAMIHQMELVGVNALAIVGLMSFLVGIVIAQQGAVQLRQFGAEIYTVNLVGRLTLRELGILMTAIMVAGRSGSAFAAQLGTMKLTEEVDAMRTIGVSPMEALVLPRILATMLMLPLLGTYSAVVGIIGGAFLSATTLGIPFLTFLARIQEVVPLHDVWVGLVKAPVFGLIVAVAGCYQGMQVKANAEEVGTRTTAAVVMAIFMVIVLDAFFAVFFTKVGWG
ncbi:MULTISPECIES: ABC transporter permease [unclassified Novosphingobium]|jgi:phospholipid/cholesterol/gamma-HCH transport system permease protein|uniref:ABC transporter permease n=1 Tax=unclassified Novosphingobium TaxID=2644732 RepID=UPI00061C3627|nr:MULTISPECIES: ABC transporter permease [unclassified Novosphingobium]MBF5091122.1 ABC transporter permease [Novosphingobium sp. NBM11]RQW45704.1 ABC transporter permease [Novosphingobium sp. LASN5T]GAO55063.1 ABC-type transport system permease component [Novosphingobium sp. MD-1]